MMVGIEAAFAINTVECAHFSVFRHEVNAQRNPEATAVNGTEYG